MFVKTILS